jgi:hypothetical protein
MFHHLRFLCEAVETRYLRIQDVALVFDASISLEQALVAAMHIFDIVVANVRMEPNDTHSDDSDAGYSIYW